MTVNILGTSREHYEKSIRNAIIVFSVAAFMCVALNVALILSVTDSTKILFTFLNIFSDAVVFCAIFGYSMLVLKDKRRKLRLYKQKDELGEITTGEIMSVKGRERIEKLDCTRVTVLEDQKERVIYLPDCGIAEQLPLEKRATFLTVNNIAVEVTYDE